MRYSKHLKWTAFILGLLFLVILAALAIGIPVTLDGIRKKVESAASAALGRKVGIDGHLTVEIGFRPAVELEGLRISNPPGWDAELFAKANRLRARIRMLPLLRRQIRVQEVSAQGLDIRLESRTDGEKNWLFDIAQKTPEAPASPTDSNDRVAIELVEVDELAFEQIHVTFFDHKTKRRSEFRLDSMQGKAVAEGVIGKNTGIRAGFV